MKFKSAQEMLSFVQNGNDLWSPSKCVYMFIYNDLGSICAYDNIDIECAKELAQEDEYWGAYLGMSGSAIYDSSDYLKEYPEMESADKITAMDFCQSMYDVTDWLVV